MALRFSGKSMDVGEALRGRAEEHFGALLLKYFNGNYTGHITLEHEGSGYRAQSMVHLDTGVVLQASGLAQEPTLAYEQMAAAIEKRLRRYNRKLKSHRRHANGADDESAPAYVLAAPIDDDEELHEDYSPPVIAESTQNLRQMSVGEAVMQLDLTQTEVVVFRHAGHGGLNVVYRRADGNIGWIDPALRPN
jgi:ribosomal subunit interface protein